MSALDGWIDVCRTGTWRDAANREVTVTEADFDGLVSAYSAQDPAPVVVGHPATDAPAYAWIDAVRRSGDRLQAKIRDVMPAFRDAVESGRYTGRSIAFTGTSLKHLGFLGGRAPAVPGLAPTRFASEPESVVVLAEAALTPQEGVRMMTRSVARLLQGMRERIIASDGIEAADEALPSWEIDHLKYVAAELGDNAGSLAGHEPNRNANNNPEHREEPMSGNNNNGGAPLDEAALAARSAELDAREQRIATSEKANATAARLAAAEQALEPHVTAGRILPAEKAPLAALLASLPEGDDTTITFASSDGEVSEKPLAVLEKFFGALPVRVNYHELSGGPMPAPAGTCVEDNEAIAAEARTLMSEASDRGETLTAVEAVDRVRAKRGLTRS